MEKALPTVAHALAQSMQNVSMNILQQEGQGSAAPLNFLLMQLMQLMKGRIEPLRSQNTAQPADLADDTGG
jgi:hypothetical protein